MSEYLNLIKKTEDLLKRILDDTKHGQVTLKGDNGLSDVEIRKPNDFNRLPLGSVISFGVCEYFLAYDGLATLWVGFDMRQVLSCHDMYIKLMEAQEEYVTICLRYKGA